MRERRRAEIVDAYVRVLARLGQSGATIAAIADEAGVAPGLVHHHFASKQDLQGTLLDVLVTRFRTQLGKTSAADDHPLAAYSETTLALGPRADLAAARAWVALFAEAQSDKDLFRRVRRLLDREVDAILARSKGSLEMGDACAVLSFVVGALVFGAFAPQKSAGFAAPRLKLLVSALSGNAKAARASNARSPREPTSRQVRMS